MNTLIGLLNAVIGNRDKLREHLKYYVPKFVWGYMIGMIGTTEGFGLLRLPLFFLSYIAYCLTMIVLIRVDYDALFIGVSRDERT